MAKTTRSSRGVTVDFDLLSIQNQLAASPKPANVMVREQLIDKKLRRRTKKLIDQLSTEDTDSTDTEQPLTPEIPQ